MPRRHPGHAARDDPRQVLVVRHSHDGHEVLLAGHGVDLGEIRRCRRWPRRPRGSRRSRIRISTTAFTISGPSSSGPLEDHGHAHAAGDAQRRQPQGGIPARAARRRMVSTMRAPVIPIGWPRAMAPPFGFSRVVVELRAPGRRRAPGAAKASFSSIDVEVLERQAGLVEHLAGGRHDADPHDTRGSTPALATPTIRASGSRPSARGPRLAHAATIAAAPSVMPEELPAVTVPPVPEHRLAARRAPRAWCPARGCSSRSTTVGPFRPGHLDRPISVAAAGPTGVGLLLGAQGELVLLLRGRSRTVAARFSAVSPITSPHSGSRNPSRYMPSYDGGVAHPVPRAHAVEQDRACGSCSPGRRPPRPRRCPG